DELEQLDPFRVAQMHAGQNDIDLAFFQLGERLSTGIGADWFDPELFERVHADLTLDRVILYNQYSRGHLVLRKIIPQVYSKKELRIDKKQVLCRRTRIRGGSRPGRPSPFVNWCWAQARRLPSSGF